MTKKILIVDDDRSILDSLTKLLRNEGYDIVTAGDGRQAAEKLLNEHIDLLLLDVGLPDRDGWLTLVWLDQVKIPCPVIVITGRINQRAQAEKFGADALMEKPLNVPCLLEMIHELANQPPESPRQPALKHAHPFRFASCDNEKFLELQNKRFNAPWPPPPEFNNN